MPYCHQCQKDFQASPPCPQCGLPLVPRATAGFGVSITAGAIVLISALLTLIFFPVVAFFLSLLGLGFLTGLGIILVMVGLVCGVLMMIGAALIYIPGKEAAGAALVLLFSIVSIVVLGGFIVGITMGIVGAALGFAKK